MLVEMKLKLQYDSLIEQIAKEKDKVKKAKLQAQADELRISLVNMVM